MDRLDEVFAAMAKVEPPDLWPRIVERVTAAPTGTAGPRGGRRVPVAVAALVVVAAGLAGFLALGFRDDTERVASEGPASGAGVHVPSAGQQGGDEETVSFCDGRETASADVDGDGLIDSVFHDRAEDGAGGPAQAVVGVCTAAGVEGTLTGLGQADLLSIVDLDRDGADEVLFGTVSDVGATYRVGRFAGDEFGLVRFDGGPFEVTFGGGGEVGTLRTLSCETGPGAPTDAQLEILTLTADAVEGPSVLRTSWVRLDGLEVIVVDEVTMDAGPWDTAASSMATAGDPESCHPTNLGDP